MSSQGLKIARQDGWAADLTRVSRDVAEPSFGVDEASSASGTRGRVLGADERRCGTK